MLTYCFISSASALPPEDQLRHVCEFSEVSDDMPAKNSASSHHSLPPRFISGGLPPIPAKLVKRIQEGLFVGFWQRLWFHHTTRRTTSQQVASKSLQRSLTSWTGFSALGCLWLLSPLRNPTEFRTSLATKTSSCGHQYNVKKVVGSFMIDDFV